MMETHSTTNAAVGDSALSRRALLIGLAGSSAATFAAASDASAALPAINATSSTSENPEILKAYDRLLAAQSELTKALATLEWLADEWKHLWPLAPEELLMGANAHKYGVHENAERDILGRPLMRETSELRQFFKRKQRESPPNTCFSILTSTRAKETIARWKEVVPKGRTEKALARHRADRLRTIAEYEHKLELALKYEAETSGLRERAGIAGAEGRVKAAKAAVFKAADAVSAVPITTAEGLRMKASALEIIAPDFFNLETTGTFGAICQLVRDAATLGRS